MSLKKDFYLCTSIITDNIRLKKFLLEICSCRLKFYFIILSISFISFSNAFALWLTDFFSSGLASPKHLFNSCEKNIGS